MIDKLTQPFSDKFDEMTADVSRRVVENTESVSEKMTEFTENVSDKTVEVTENVSEGITEATESVSDFVSDNFSDVVSVMSVFSAVTGSLSEQPSGSLNDRFEKYGDPAENVKAKNADESESDYFMNPRIRRRRKPVQKK